jgi:hypothetical protein
MFFKNIICNLCVVKICLDAANESCSPSPIHFSELYNMALDHVDLLREYCMWQSTPNKFSYCQFPFLLSIAAKRYILTKVRCNINLLVYYIISYL